MKTEFKKCECNLIWKLTPVQVPGVVGDAGILNCSCGRILITSSFGATYTSEKVEIELIQCPKGHCMQIYVRPNDTQKLHQFACRECFSETHKLGEFHRHTRTPVGIVPS